MTHYTGRFAPSPTGPLHAGSVVAALASWLDARAHGGTWLVRMEDVDEPRCRREHGEHILHQLAELGLQADAPVQWQSQRTALYTPALAQLQNTANAYGCACSRKAIEAHYLERGINKPRNGEWVYPGTCRDGLHGQTARAWRFRIPEQQAPVHWQDRRLGAQVQDVRAEVGDFVLRRADGFFAYQLAVVVDDAQQGITHVVRGQDLADNTARQILLQRALGHATPTYLHTPLVLGANGEKLSKQNGAQAANTTAPLPCIAQAAQVLGLHVQADSVAQALTQAVAQWRGLYNLSP
jgi:glutamyl-Q tRNA(Asp) synthetase